MWSFGKERSKLGKKDKNDQRNGLGGRIMMISVCVCVCVSGKEGQVR